MQKRPVLIIFFLFFLPSLLAFDCSSITTSTQCTQLTGCSWSGTACTGTWTASCTIPTCYYIDPVNGTDTGDGSPANPYKTLTPGFQQLASASGNLTVINNAAGLEVQILSFVTISSTVVVQRLFSGNKYILSTQNFDTTTISASYPSTAIYISSGKLTIIGAIINAQVIKTGIQTVFEVGNAGLTLNDVWVKDYQGSAMLVHSASTATSAAFTLSSSWHTNSAFNFSLPAGSHALTIVGILNTKAVDPIFYLGTTVALSGIYVSGGQALLVQIVKDTTFTATNITFDTYSGNFLLGNYITKFTLTSSVFQNLTLVSSSPLIRITSVGTGYGAAHAITSVTFQNISVKTSVILLENSYQRITLSGVTMKDIRQAAIPSSEQTIDDIEFAATWPGGLCFRARNSVGVTITSSFFYQIQSICIALTSSALTLTSNVFDNSALTGVTQVSADSITESDGVTWVSFDGGSADVLPGSAFKVTTCTFSNNKVMSMYGGAIRFTGSFALTLTLSGNQFINNTAVYGGAIYSENPLLNFISGSDTFYDNSATIGGAVYKMSDVNLATGTSVTTITIAGSNFTANTASTKGGSIYLNYEGLALSNSIFYSNTAEYGGALYYMLLNRTTNTTNRKFDNNTFTLNSASTAGNSLFLLFDYSSLNENATIPSFPNNDTRALQVSDGIPSYYRFSFFNFITDKTPSTYDNLTSWVYNTSLTEFAFDWNTSAITPNFQIDHKSGQALTQLIRIEVYDNHNKLCTYINDEKMTVSITDTQNTISSFQAFVSGNEKSFTFIKGVLYMNPSVKIVGEPTTTATLTFEYDSLTADILDDANLLLDQDMPVYFIKCQIGDIYSSTTKQCDTCDEGTYSLSDPYSDAAVCELCDNTKATCLGGSRLAPKPGYWRYDTMTDNILECPESEACLGGYINEVYDPNGQCEYPYSGNLCNTCLDQYAKFGSSAQCVNCQTDALYYVKFVGYFLVQLIALLYSVRANLAKISNIKKAQHENDQSLREQILDDEFQSNIMKIVVNFAQICSVLTQYQLEWPNFIDQLGAAVGKIGSNSKDGFSVDCILALFSSRSDLIYFIKLVIILVEPFVMWFAMILSYMIYLKVKKEPISGSALFRKNVMVLFIITAFLLQPNIIQTTLQVFKCENFSSSATPVYFMIDNSETRCWGASHLIWGLAVALPNFFLWAVVLPLLLWKKIKKQAKHLKDPEVYAKYSFVYEGLRTDKYYWEFIIVVRKALVVIIYVFFGFISIQAQAFATLLVILGSCALQYKFRPYNDNRLNRAEMFSLLALGVLVYCGMYFLSGDGGEWIKVMLVVFASIFTFGFFIYMARLLIETVIKTIKRLRTKVKDFSEKIKEKREKKRTNSQTSSTGSAPDRKMIEAICESPKFEIVFNKIDILGSDLDKQLDAPNDVEQIEPVAEKEGEFTVPSEIEAKLGLSKTVYNEERSDVDNYSILKSPTLYRSEKSKGPSQGNSIASLLSPDQVQDMMNLIQLKKSSRFNSNELKLLVENFSASSRGQDSGNKIPEEESQPE